LPLVPEEVANTLAFAGEIRKSAASFGRWKRRANFGSPSAPLQAERTMAQWKFLWSGGSTMVAHLRVYPLAKDEPDIIGQEPSVRVCLGDLLPLVALAHRHNYLWLQDFLEDEVVITSDLYEVLRAFRCSRPSA
jgi:hypothetical protein